MLKNGLYKELLHQRRNKNAVRDNFKYNENDSLVPALISFIIC